MAYEHSTNEESEVSGLGKIVMGVYIYGLVMPVLYVLDFFDRLAGGYDVGDEADVPYSGTEESFGKLKPHLDFD